MPTVTWHHIHLRSPDPEATATWFERILGGEIVRLPGRTNVKQGLDHIGLAVTDVDAAAAELKAKGVEFTKEPTTIAPGLRICFIRGPQGISIELLERDEKYKYP
jgi:catechol 2,3-dioxygenase-like lactoylglutathione lyase family enzyme